MLAQVTNDQHHIDRGIQHLENASFFFDRSPSIPAFQAVADHMGYKKQAAELEKLVFDPKESIQARVLAFELISVSRQTAKTRELAERFLENKDQSLPEGWGGDTSLKYLAGRFGDGASADQEYLRQANKTGYGLCIAYFQIGLLKLAEGDRTEAKRYFELAFETNASGMFEYALAKALYRLLERDDKWLSWIPPDGEADE